MWKSNRKDECYDVYNDACVECHDKLITTELKTPLNDAITTGTSLVFVDFGFIRVHKVFPFKYT